MEMIKYHNNLFVLSANNTSYIVGLENGIPLTYYWGAKLNDSNIKDLVKWQPVIWSPLTDAQQHELPVYGTGDYRTPMLEIVFENGSRVTDFRYKSHAIYKGKPKLPALPATYTESDDEASTLEIQLADDLSNVWVTLIYSIFENGAISRSIRIKNMSEREIKLKRVLSASVDFHENDFESITLEGAWARERHLERGKLFHGVKSIASSRGASSHNKNPFLCLVHPKTDENQGEVYAMNLVYSGNFEANVELSSFDTTRMQIGINSFDFLWTLKQHEEFQSPEAILVYSNAGLNAMSHIYHQLYRTRLCRGKYRDTPRPVLINNWEATYFDFDETKIVEIAKAAKEIGVELFVLDDGWFGKRNDDTSSLGDWVVNQQKLPNGIDGLAKKINEIGMEFGLWFEPEMVSPDSDLYRAHPDWCIHIDGREKTLVRTQLVLDLSKDEVCDYIITAVSDILKNANIKYVKWDMNRSMTEIPHMDTAHRYILGLYRVLETITTQFPDVLFESCSGGGGRFDAGMLYYMPQIWTSDNTDAVERLFIQYGTSLVYPMSSMGAHVSAVPNHQTGRVTDLKMRGDAALSGAFGYELDLSQADEEEKRIMKAQIEFYKANQTLIQCGDFYRIESPFESNYCAWQYVSKDKKESIVCAFRKLYKPNTLSKRIKLAGLDPDANYLVNGKTMATGDVLMKFGLLFVFENADFKSSVLKIQKTDLV